MEANAAISNPEQIIKSWIATTNDAFRKSGLDEERIKLHCTEKISIMDNDHDSSEARLTAFDNAKGDLAGLLNTADIAILLTRSGVSGGNRNSRQS